MSTDKQVRVRWFGWWFATHNSWGWWRSVRWFVIGPVVLQFGGPADAQ